jgi:hypothetical protein
MVCSIAFFLFFLVCSMRAASSQDNDVPDLLTDPDVFPCRPYNKRPRRVDRPAGVGALGIFARISSKNVDLILDRVRANPGCLQSGPQSYKWHLEHERNKLIKDLAIVIDVPLKKGDTFSWGILNPAALLQHYSRCSKAFQDMVKKARERHPGKWHLILYEDEVQPGNAFLGKRKLHSWYFSFREFDQQISDENAWVCFAVLQSCIVANVRGAFSCVSKLVHQSLFTLKAPNFGSGVAVLCPEPYLVQVDLEDLQDADALKYKWDIKGHGGLKPCIHCSNCFMKGHKATEAHANFVDITNLDWDRVKNFQATDQEIWKAQDELVGMLDVRGGSETRKKLETVYGQNANRDGLLACKELRHWVKPSRTSFDPMHCLFSNGIADLEVTRMCGALDKLHFDFRKIEAFVNMGWAPAKQLQFSKDGVKGMASECLRSVPLLRHFLVKLVKPSGLLVDEIASFEALADVVQQVQKIKLYSEVPHSEADKLQSLMAVHFCAFKKAWGTAEVLPKHHYTMHIPEQVKRLGILVDAFACERKNKLPKEVVEHYKTAKITKLLELSIVTRMNLVQLEDLHRSPSPGQVIEPSQTFGDFVVGKSARLHFGSVHAGQAFLTNGSCFILQACLTNDAAGLILLAKKYDFVTTDTHPAAKVWRDSGEDVCFATDDPFMCQVHTCFFKAFLLKAFREAFPCKSVRKAFTSLSRPTLRPC